MFKSILVPIDLADTDLAKPAIATAATLSQTWNGAVRLLNIMPMTPVMLAEYVPADFDVPAARNIGGSARDRGARIRHRAVAHFRRGTTRRHLSRDPRRGGGNQGRLDRDDVAPAGDADLFPRLQCRPCGALCQMFGAGGAALGPQIRSLIPAGRRNCAQKRTGVFHRGVDLVQRKPAGQRASGNQGSWDMLSVVTRSPLLDASSIGNGSIPAAGKFDRLEILM